MLHCSTIDAEGARGRVPCVYPTPEVHSPTSPSPYLSQGAWRKDGWQRQAGSSAGPRGAQAPGDAGSPQAQGRIQICSMLGETSQEPLLMLLPQGRTGSSSSAGNQDFAPSSSELLTSDSLYLFYHLHLSN